MTIHRNPSKYVPEEKLMNAGELKEPRLGMFKELVVLSEKYNRKNQYE